MTAATITPAMAGADLMAALRDLLQRHEGAESPEDVGQLLDDVSVALRRARGRVNRFAKKQAEQAPPKAEAAPERPEPERKPAVPAAPPAQRADVKLPPSGEKGVAKDNTLQEPKPQQERPPRPPKEAPETPPEPRRSRWPGRLNTAVLALVCAVIALIIGARAVCSLVVRAVCGPGRRVIRAVGRFVGALSLRGER